MIAILKGRIVDCKEQKNKEDNTVTKIAFVYSEGDLVKVKNLDVDSKSIGVMAQIPVEIKMVVFNGEKYQTVKAITETNDKS